MRPFLLLLIPSMAFGTHYYVKNSGNDGSAGTTDGTAWATVAKINASSFSPGDTISFAKGSTWREGLDVPSSGTAGSPIVFNSYGSGAKPIFLGSFNKSTTGDWTNDAGNIWKSTAKFTRTRAGSFPDVGNLVFNTNSCGRKKFTSKSQCTVQGDFFYSRVDSLVYIYSVGNPASYYTDIEVVTKYPETGESYPGDALIYAYDQDYLVFNGFDLRYLGAHGLSLTGGCTNVTVENCEFSWFGGALQVLEDSTRYGNGFQAWNAHTDIIVRYCTFQHGYDEGFTSQGVGTGYAVDRVWFHHNLVTDCSSGMTFMHYGTGITVDSVFFENNTFVNLGGFSMTQRSDSLSSAGIWFADATGATYTNIFVRNNIVDSIRVMSGTFSQGGGTAGQLLHLHTNISAGQRAAITLSNNSYNKSDGTAIYWNSTAYTSAQFATYQSASGKDANSRAGASGFVSMSDFALVSTSACRDAGTDLGYTQDILGNPIVGLPDIGAYEYQSSPPPAIIKKLIKRIYY